MTMTTKTLLDHVRTLVEAEQGLTEALEKCVPLLSYDRQSSSSVVLSSSQRSRPPLLPTPRDPSEVPAILAVARAYSLRTSAPPMWNPGLPVIGFATPNPLPHQLRGGALGAMQLRMAREERSRKSRELADRRERERRRIEEDEKRTDAGKEDAAAMEVDGASADANAKRKREGGGDAPGGDDAKRRETAEMQKRQMAQRPAASSGKLKHQSAEELKRRKEAANMNLDSSSSEESSDEEDESD